MKHENRLLIYERFGGRCFYCGSDLDPGKWQVEHKTARSLGGGSKPDNLVPSCRFCNYSKMGRDSEGFKEYKKSQMIGGLSRALEVLAYLNDRVPSEQAEAVRSKLNEAAELIHRLPITWYGEEGASE